MVLVRNPLLDRLYTDLPKIVPSEVPSPEVEIPEGANLGPVVEHDTIKRFVGVIGQYAAKIDELSKGLEGGEVPSEVDDELGLYEALYQTAVGYLGINVGMIYGLTGKQVAICKDWQLVWRDPPKVVEMALFGPGCCNPFGEDTIEFRRVSLE